MELRRLRRACTYFANNMQSVPLIRELLNETERDETIPLDSGISVSISVVKFARFDGIMMLQQHCQDTYLFMLDGLLLSRL